MRTGLRSIRGVFTHNRLSAISSLLVLTCCAPQALQSTTLSQGATFSDIYNDEALSNLEMFRQNMDAVPWHLKLTQGSISINDSLTPSFSYVWPAVARTLGITGERTWALSWTVVPTIDVAQLTSLQLIYQCEVKSGQILGSDGKTICTGTEPQFSATFQEGLVPPVDTDFGSYKGISIWVKKGHEAALSELVFNILTQAKVLNGERAFQLPGPTLSP